MRIYYLILFIGLTFSACAPKITKHEFAPNMYEQQPISILVLPPQNNSTAADAKEYYSTTIAEPLTNSGYYVYPIEIVNEVLKQEGLFDTETMLNIPAQKFKEYFGADAVMYVKILEWDTQYLILSGNVTVKIQCEIVSTTSGDLLWFYDDVVTANTSGSSGGAGGLAGLLVQAISTAIQTAATQYVPLARKVNEKVLLAIPYGKYHADFGRDKQMKIEKKQKLEDNKDLQN